MDARATKRSEAWLTTAITSGIVAGLSAATIAVWAWWIDKVDGAFRYCEVGDGSDVTHGTLVWKLVPPGPRCVYTEQVNGFDGSRINWPWAILVGLAVVSTALACYATVRHLVIKRRLGRGAGADSASADLLSNL